MKFNFFALTTLLFPILALVSSCTNVIRVAPSQVVPEESYCTTDGGFSGNTIDGYAYYKRRDLGVTGLEGISATDYPIRRAEVRVLDSSGSVVHCTETDNFGYYAFDLPDNDSNYTVRIYSRSYNVYSKVSVLGNPNTNRPYYISRTFVSDSTKTLVDTLAQADTSIDSTLKGGAFNILDKIYEANDYLLNNTGGTFTVDHKVRIYWEKGVNPVGYFGGDTSSGVSFYIPGSDNLYILGGIDGDVTTSDTDHFDDSVLVHEYGHFLEDNYSRSDSQGGTHYGLYVIDPRLAWSEGFSTFLAAKVLNDPIYKDTIGIGQGYGYYYDMENNLNGDNDPQDMPTAGALGEGGFRELAVSRMLWASTDALMPFSEFWDLYVGDFKSTLSFREMSLFLKVQDDGGGTDISTLLDDDDKEMTATRAHYGVEDNAATTGGPYNTGDTADLDCRWTIVPANPVPISGSTFDRSNQFYSNDFFYVDHPGGNLSVTLEGVSGTGDLDLYIYKSGYEFGVGDDLLDYSNDSNTFDEYVSVNAPAGKYMVNIMYYGATAAGSTTVYNLTISRPGDLNNVICR